MQSDLTGQNGFWYPDPFGPAFDMVINMNNDQDIFDYVRSVNFETGETLVHWTDKQGTYERRLNLASMHNHKSLFNMDISGGMPAVIIKMLVGSGPGEIHLLPALPTVWSKGEIQGVLCRGQIEITSLVWDDKQVKVNLVSKIDQTIVIRAFDESMEIELKAEEGKTVVFI